MNRGRRVGGLMLAVCAGLLAVLGCSADAYVKVSSSTTSSPSSTSTVAPIASKEAFCRDINSAVNIQESSASTLTEAQTDGMIKALESASNEAPADVPADFKQIVTSMVADLQAPTTSLPPSWNTNATKTCSVRR